MRLSGADIIVRTIIEQGTKTVFGYPGGQIINVYDSLYKYQDELRHVLCAHEQGAAHAADGYARATGEVGVVIATSGPGATNLVTGIATAYLDSVPLVAITGNVPSYQLGTDSFQEIDITGITLPITKHNYVVGSAEELADTIREAYKLALSDRPGPVLVDVPKDIQIAQCEYEPLSPVCADQKMPAKDVRIEQAAACINLSHMPYVYFGGGLINSDAEEELLELAEKIDAPIGCSFMGISGVPTDHPRFLGMQGMHGHYASSMAMHQADCIIALGVRFNDRVTGNRERFATRSQIVHIDIDGAELSKNVSPAHALRGDLKLTLQKLLPLLEPKEHPKWQSAIDQLKNDERWSMDRREGMTPRNVLLALNRYTGGKLPVATDVGQHQMWAAQTCVFSEKRRFISSGGLGTMGFGMGAAMGAQLATGQRTVLVTGDGSFGMCLNELATAVHERIPLVILLLNNGVLGMVRQWQTLFFDKHYSNTVLDRATDFVALSKAFGADGVRVTDLDGLDSALSTAFKSDGPYLIECIIDKDEFVLPMLPPGGSMDDIITKVGG
ncbi:MAG: biosynthetic-type acetolactate synthase large subunit [Acutalibacter sp.]|uniref:biosynthetic-type acetolactate synthase large subunit n=1 Tax=Acutalibacter sp. TaxID=1918636 RepID=UPI00217151FC|nr:biosynthetic-type acetolactate synthase large subunit [Acutalibacter sp.]MCI9225510.1 biosynthetic-type acetolactate synthase large subunit [Acutalibacter sp.]